MTGARPWECTDCVWRHQKLSWVQVICVHSCPLTQLPFIHSSKSPLMLLKVISFLHQASQICCHQSCTHTGFLLCCWRQTSFSAGSQGLQGPQPNLQLPKGLLPLHSLHYKSSLEDEATAKLLPPAKSLLCTEDGLRLVCFFQQQLSLNTDPKSRFSLRTQGQSDLGKSRGYLL